MPEKPKGNFPNYPDPLSRKYYSNSTVKDNTKVPTPKTPVGKAVPAYEKPEYYPYEVKTKKDTIEYERGYNKYKLNPKYASTQAMLTGTDKEFTGTTFAELKGAKATTLKKLQKK